MKGLINATFIDFPFINIYLVMLFLFSLGQCMYKALMAHSLKEKISLLFQFFIHIYQTILSRALLPLLTTAKLQCIKRKINIF